MSPGPRSGCGMSSVFCHQCGHTFARERDEANCPKCQAPVVLAEPTLTAQGDTEDYKPAPMPFAADVGQASAAPKPELPGYEILGVIGRGGMGVVYRARQLALDRQVAIKSLRWSDPDAAAQLARFEQEARTIAKLRHANIVTAFDLRRQGDSLYLVMELLDGEDVARHVRRVGPLDEAKTWALIGQATAGLRYAAELGVVHRDIKPANMILVRVPGGGGELLLKVTDFGLALLGPDVVEEQHLTRPGAIIGTPAFMAPEQFAGSRVDWRADQYALGLTALFMLSGRHPYDRQTLWDIMKHKMEHGPSLPDNVSPITRALLERMLARAPQQRFATYAEMSAAIATAAGSEPTAAISTPARRRAPSSAWLAAGIVVALLGLWAAYRLLQPGIPEPPHMPIGKATALFDGVNLFGWLPGDGTWQTAADAEGGAVLSGSGSIRRPLPRMPYYRLLIGVDQRGARGVEVHFGMRGDDCHVLRVLADVVQLGSRRGGEEMAIDSALPRKATEDSVSSPYRELRVDRTPRGWFAFYDGKLVGHVATTVDDVSEFRLHCEGGPAYFESIQVLELLDKETAP